jgi:hypothetical protein
MSNKISIVTVGLLCCLSGSVMAQQTGNANSSSSSGSTAGSTATSNSNVGTSRATGGQASANPTATASAGSASATTGPVTLNVYGTDPNSSGTGAASGTAGTAGTSGVGTTSTDNVNYSGTTTVRNTPDVGAPAIYGGTNPCSVGASAGLGIPGFGLSGGATWSDHGCERRNTAVILYQANKARVAEALLCQDKDTRAAFMAAGDPCPQDRTPVAQAAAPVQVASVAPASPVVAAAPTVPPTAPEAQVTPRKVSTGYVGPKPAWCASPVKDSTDQAYHSFYCGA